MIWSCVYIPSHYAWYYYILLSRWVESGLITIECSLESLLLTVWTYKYQPIYFLPCLDSLSNSRLDYPTRAGCLLASDFLVDATGVFLYYIHDAHWVSTLPS